MLFVASKSIEQQDIQSLHRVRERLKNGRTRLANQMRGLLTEYGIVIPKGIWHLRQQIPDILEDASNELMPKGRALFAELYEEFCEMDRKIKAYDAKLETIFNQSEVCQRLAAIEGLGVISTTALVATDWRCTCF